MLTAIIILHFCAEISFDGTDDPAKFERGIVYHAENIYNFIIDGLREITVISVDRVVWLLLFKRRSFANIKSHFEDSII
jgi:hypothetical protein